MTPNTPSSGLLSRRLTQLRRDLRALAGPFLGEVSKPFTPRDASGWPAPRRAEARGLARRRVRVSGLRRLTPDAVEITLDADTPVAWRPGQFLTLELEVDGERLRRAYSLCGPPGSLQIGVKRISGGRASTWLNAQLELGQTFDVLGPSGDYGLRPDPDVSRHVLLIAGGSGVTPQLAIARAVLALEPASRVTLLFGNRAEADIMFREDLDALVEAHPGRFTCRHVLEAPPAGWTGGEGRLDGETLARELDALGSRDGPDHQWFLCGPAPMMEAAQALLTARSVPPGRLHQERFTAAPDLQHVSLPERPLALTVRASGVSRVTQVQPGQTLLEAGLSAGASMPYSCAMGGCGACKVQLRAGEVHMRAPNCLSAEERSAGHVLACVAHPLSPVTLEIPG